MTVMRAQQPFARAILADLRFDDIGALDREMLFKPGPLRLGDIGHFLERRGAAIIDPVPDLLGAQFGLLFGHSRRQQRFAHLRLGQADEVHFPIGTRRRPALGGHGVDLGRESASRAYRHSWSGREIGARPLNYQPFWPRTPPPHRLRSASPSSG